MRRRTTIVIGLAMLTAIPAAPAEARNLLGTVLGAPFAIIGGVAGAAIGTRAARSRARHRHDRAQTSQVSQIAGKGRQSEGWSGPVYGPHVSDAMFDYVFGSPRDNNRFWQRGYGDVIQAAFMSPRKRASANRTRPTRIADGDPNDKSASPPWASLCGSEEAGAADAVAERIRTEVQPTPAQDAAFQDVKSGLNRAFERIKSVCPTDQLAKPSDRLNGMVTRLTAMGQAALMVRTPLRAFYDVLTPQQKAALDNAAGTGTAAVASNDDASKPETTGSASAEQARTSAQPLAECATQVAIPKEQLQRMRRAKPEQRANLERFQGMSQQMAELVTTSCPTQTAGTVVDRLDAVKSRVTVLRYATLNMMAVVTRMAASEENGAGARKGRGARK